MEKFILKGGEVVSSEGVYRADVLVVDGKIADISEELSGDAQEVDCRGKLILPGAIDIHVHFREPGASHKEDWEHASAAAVSGGVTTVCDMPNNNPPIVDADSLDAKRKLVKGRSHVNYAFYLGYNGKNVEEINKAVGIAGVKVYCAHSTGDMGVDAEFLEKAFTDIRQDIRLMFHAEDEDCIEQRFEEMKAEGREFLPADHSKIRAPECALKMTEKLCDLAKKHQRKIHICHVSTGAEIEVINSNRQWVSCEVAPHHLVLSTDDYQSMGNLIKMNPPVREGADLFALWKALRLSEVDLIATDHAPHTLEEKQKPYLEAPSGVPGVEMMLPIMLNAVNDEGITIEEVVRLCCEKPAELLGLENKGKIEVGADADLVIVDMEKSRKFENEDVRSKCGWSPYAGGVYKGWPVATYLAGQVIFEENKIIGEKNGEEIRFS